MSFKICTIASGSKGNCTYIECGGTHLLVDAGIPLKRLERELSELDIKLSQIDGVLITHEHADHICGLKQLADAGVPVYAHERALSAICRKSGALSFESVDFYDGGFEIGAITVRPFRIPHDAAYPMAYAFQSGGEKVSVATDIGHITEGLISNLKGSTTVLLEANHDLEMLLKGGYSPQLKRRISGANGHLSNDSAGIIALNLLPFGLKNLILGHLSEENNYPELAFSTVVQAVEREGAREGRDIHITVASQYKKGDIIETDEKTF